jgi:large subunit ribosomal protein L31
LEKGLISLYNPRLFRSGAPMKSGIHPEYQPVIFLDTSVNHSFLTRSAVDTKGRETMKWTDGNEYPVVKLEVSSESHSFYTGKQKIVDTAGRVEKFKRRYTKKPTP